MAETKSYKETYARSYNSFAGTDIVATITMPFEYGGGSHVLGELQTISYSVHREIEPVYRLGYTRAVGFTSGYRTIAGSLIFTVFNRNIAYVLRDLILGKSDLEQAKAASSIVPVVNTQIEWLTDRAWASNGDWGRSGIADNIRRNSLRNQPVLMDEMPPFNINVIMRNEYGQSSYLTLSEVVIVDEGQVMSIEDLLVENTYSFMARSLSPLRPWEVQQDG